jgi:hypothetical protein
MNERLVDSFTFYISHCFLILLCTKHTKTLFMMNDVKIWIWNNGGNWRLIFLFHFSYAFRFMLIIITSSSAGKCRRKQHSSALKLIDKWQVPAWDTDKNTWTKQFWGSFSKLPSKRCKNVPPDMRHPTCFTLHSFLQSVSSSPSIKSECVRF